MSFPYIRHGSEDSLDEDVHILIPEALPRGIAKSMCDAFFKFENPNLIVVEGGVVAWTYKGAVDETNNAILRTYGHHKQEHPNPIKMHVTRNVAVKIARTVRGLLGVVSRTQYRSIVKPAIANHDSMQAKLDALRKVDLMQIEDFGKRDTVDSRKFIAFQVAQCLALARDGYEIYTKSEAAIMFPELRSCLYREGKPDLVALQAHQQELIGAIEAQCGFGPGFVATVIELPTGPVAQGCNLETEQPTDVGLRAIDEQWDNPPPWPQEKVEELNRVMQSIFEGKQP